MYVCLECGNVFDEDEVSCWVETHGLDHGPYEHLSGCPSCRGAYTEAYTCDACGEYINTETYVQIGDQRYCENCFITRTLGEE